MAFGMKDRLEQLKHVVSRIITARYSTIKLVSRRRTTPNLSLALLKGGDAVAIFLRVLRLAQERKSL